MTRKQAIRELKIRFVGEYDRQREAKDMAIKALEQESRKGEWQLTDDEMFVYCPFCHDTEYARPIDASWKYCPNCGARLD